MRDFSPATCRAPLAAALEHFSSTSSPATEPVQGDAAENPAFYPLKSSGFETLGS